MPSHREQVLEAAKALVAAALPFADVSRNGNKPQRIGAGGTVVLHDGDPGEPEVTLSPLRYTYEHPVELDVAAYETASKTREQVLDEMFTAIGAAVELDRTLGGLCEWVEASAPAPEDIEAPGVEPVRWAQLNLTCVYTTSNPLG